jgi:hypothetical protein
MEFLNHGFLGPFVSKRPKDIVINIERPGPQKYLSNLILWALA